MKLLNNVQSIITKLLLPLLIVAALAYWWMNKDKNTVQESDKVETISDQRPSNNAAKTTINTTKKTESADNTSPSSYSLNSNGDVVNGNGAIVFANGSYEFDQKGNLIDKNNKRIILPAASISRDFADKLNSLLSGLSSTVTSNDMQSLFNDMSRPEIG